MNFVGESFRFIHVLFGAIGLAAFWVPVFAKKGAVNHVRFGKIFVWSAYIVLAAAGIALVVRVSGLLENGVGLDDEPSLYGFIVFLGYLTFVTFVFVRHGMAVLQNKRDFAGLQTTLNKSLAYGAILASTGLILYALILAPPNKILLFALSPIGFAGGFGNLAHMRSDPLPKRAWMYEHIGAMLGSGIAFHTAFAVFGSTRLFDIGLTGWAAIIPWIAPTAIGIPAIFLWTRHYRLKYGDPA
jgi:hypothetical protein